MEESDIARAEQRVQEATEAAVRGIRRQLEKTLAVGTKECVDCGEEIPEARRIAVPHARRCTLCQQGVER